MSQTDTRPGFRLPWTAERGDGEAPTDGAPGASTGDASAEASATSETESPAEGSDGTGTVDDQTASEEIVTSEMIDATAVTNGRRPTKFMADLSRAMQTAAETSRDESMTRFAADAKVAIDDIRSRSAEEAAALRRQADDDVAAVREWSKTEIARIREETDSRIAARKQALDGEMDAFAAVIEARVERVNATVGEFETEMAEFFERLLAEQDPTRIATMAQAMPDPPDLSAVAASVTEAPPRVDKAPEATSEAVPAEAQGDAVTDAPAEGTEAIAESAEYAEAAAAPAEVTQATDVPTEEAGPIAEGEATQIGETETMPNAPEGESTQEQPTAEAEPTEASTEPETGEQPAPDFAAAEAEAAAMSGELDADDGLTMLAAARLDSLMESPGVEATERPTAGDRVTTRVVVRGLVSVASIATFKRSLGRVGGVAAIGVASGPDGEFVFTVSHDSGLNLTESIVGLPGFDAKISSETPGNLEVAAHDPDSND
jgi:hypothetical protein